MKIQDGGSRNLENHKNRDISQRFDRSLRNLVRWCKMGLLTAPTVKNFEFLKIQDGGSRYLEKSQKSRYLRYGLTDLCEIWYAGAKWVS